MHANEIEKLREQVNLALETGIAKALKEVDTFYQKPGENSQLEKTLNALAKEVDFLLTEAAWNNTQVPFPDLQEVNVTIPNMDTLTFMLLGECRNVRAATLPKLEEHMTRKEQYIAELDSAIDCHAYLVAALMADPSQLPASPAEMPYTFTIQIGFPFVFDDVDRIVDIDNCLLVNDIAHYAMKNSR